jgi:DNA-binding LytR/AlgR family response regulator
MKNDGIMIYLGKLCRAEGGAFMKIVICEDSKDDRSALSTHIMKYLNENGSDAELAVYESGEAFLSDWETIKTDDVKIAFLDIYMTGMSGIEVAERIRSTGDSMVIIFTTVSRDHGLDGYTVKALQYLVKPVGYPEIVDVLNGCMALFADSLRYIEVLSDKIAVKVLLKDITHVEVYSNYCLIHTTTGVIKCRLTLDEIEQRLANGGFLRTHRSYVVNMRYIQSVAEDDFVLTNGTLIPIRRNDKLAVKQIHMDYLFALRRRK